MKSKIYKLEEGKRQGISKGILLKTILVLLLATTSFSGFSQEGHGSALNLGLGVGGHYGYYRHVARSFPVLHIDYEFGVAKNFTLAPFVNMYTYNNSYYWGNKDYPYRYYNYHETGIQLGGKGTYYFDDLLQAGPKWDFYLAGSLGVTIIKSTWDDGYYGDRNVYARSSPLYIDLHIGTEYHFNSRVGMFLDLSTGINTIGVAIH